MGLWVHGGNISIVYTQESKKTPPGVLQVGGNPLRSLIVATLLHSVTLQIADRARVSPHNKKDYQVIRLSVSAGCPLYFASFGTRPRFFFRSMYRKISPDKNIQIAAEREREASS